MAPQKDDVLNFKVGVDIRDSLKAMEEFQRAMMKAMEAMSTSGQKAGKESERTAKRGKRSYDDWASSVDGVNDAYERQNAKLKNLGDTIRQLQTTLKDAADDNKESIQEEIDILEKKYRTQLKGVKKGPGRKSLAMEFFAPKGFKKAIVDAGERLADPLRSFLKKDAQGLFEDSAKIFSDVVKRSYKGMRILGDTGARHFKVKGAKAQIAGRAKGGLGGAVTAAGGTAMKALGGAMGWIGKAIRPLAALAPLIGIVNGFMIGLVKLFIEADAMAKDFNKEIMGSASNLEIFSRSGKSAELAGTALESTLTELRDAAYDVKTNLTYGLTKDDHKAMLNTLTQEGVSLGRLDDEAIMAGKSVRELATQFTVTGVAYSRAFGVALSEVGQIQSEMMTEMGMSADKTRESFALMATAAGESGMAANKFFNVIRSISPDLSLFNLRLEDSVGLLAKMSKVMNPRDAAKFMQEASTGLKNMGRQEKMRLGYFAGNAKLDQLTKRDIERKTKVLVDTLAQYTNGKAEDIQTAFEDHGLAGVQSLIDQLPEEIKGGVASNAIDLQLQKSSATKGLYGKQMGISRLGMGAQLELQQSALTKYTKGKYSNISDAVGDVGLEQTAEALGMSPEQVDAMAKLEIAINAQRKELATTNADADNMGYDQIIESMSQSMKDELKADLKGESIEKKMLKLSQEQSMLTTSWTQRLEVLIDWLMNAFYDAVLGIWDAVLSIPLVGRADLREQLADLRAIRKTKAEEVKGIVAKGGDLGKALSESKVMVGFKAALSQRATVKSRDSSLGGQIRNLEGKLGKMSSKDPQREVLEDQLATTKGLYDQNKKLLDAIEPLFNEAASFSPYVLAEALKEAGLDFGPEVAGGQMALTEFPVNVKKFGYEKAAEMAGATPEQTNDALTKTVWGRASSGEKSRRFARIEAGLKDVPGTPQAGKPVTPDGAVPRGSKPTSAVTTAPTAGSPSPIVDNLESSNETLTHVAEDTTKTKHILAQRGAKLAPATIKEQTKGFEESMLSALRIALFEYYLYSGTDRTTLLTQMKKGNIQDPRVMAQRMSEESVNTGSTMGALTKLGEAPGNDAGGLVTGIARGMAVVAHQGEGLASVGRGERIVPANGGGSGGVHVSVNGIGGPDLARLIEGKVVEGIREYKRREKFN